MFFSLLLCIYYFVGRKGKQLVITGHDAGIHHPSSPSLPPSLPPFLPLLPFSFAISVCLCTASPHPMSFISIFPSPSLSLALSPPPCISFCMLCLCVGGGCVNAAVSPFRGGRECSSSLVVHRSQLQTGGLWVLGCQGSS